MKTRNIILTMVLLALTLSAAAQSERARQRMEDMESASFVPLVKVGKVLEGGDSIQYMEMYNVYVYPELEFKNERQKQSYLTGWSCIFRRSISAPPRHRMSAQS